MKKSEIKVKRKFLRRAKRIPASELDATAIQIVVVSSILEELEDEVEREYEVNKSKTLGPIFKILKKFDGFKSLLFYILFITFFFQKPQWCSKTEGMSPDCNKDKDGNIYYVSKLLALPPFVITYSNFITWSCMFILIVGDVLSVLFIGNWTYKLRVVSMMIMFAADVVFTALTDKIKFFLFEYNLGPFFRIIFMILYNTGLRNSMKRLISTMTGAYEALLTFLLNLAIWSGFAFILFQDIETYYDDEKYYSFKFTNYLASVWSMYVLQTKVNHPNLFLKVYERRQWAAIFFMIYSFVTIFLIMNIIVSIFYITYKKHYAKIVFELGSYERASVEDYSRIIACATTDDGLIVQSVAREMCKEYLLKGPEYLNYIMAKQLQKRWLIKQEDKLLPPGVRDVGYNMKHRPYFKVVNNSRFYRYFWCGLSLYIFIAPVLILDYPRDTWELTHYNLVEYASLALLIDPILVLVFMGTDKFRTNSFYIFEIFSSVGIIALSIASDFLVPSPPLTLEQTNYNFYLIYSILCFSKCGRIFNQVLKELPQTKAVIGVLRSIGPFLFDLMGMLVNIFLIFGQIGINLFGGNINSTIPAKFLKDTGRKLPENYEQMNFNDFPNAIVFLWNIFINNNWVEMSYMALINFSNKYFDRWAKYYFVIFFIFTSFFVMNIITGFIIEVILSHLNQKYVNYFKLSDEAIQAIRDQDEYSETSTSEEEDENVFVDDEAEMDLEARIRLIFEELNKGLSSNLRTFGVGEREHSEDSKMLDEIRLI